MKKTKIVKALSVIMCVIITVTGMCIPASAAVKGSTMDNAITVSFGQSYSKSWTKKTLRVNCYNKIKISNRGILTINASKPYDDDGEYGELSFKLYDSDGEIVWANDTMSSVESASSKYKKYVGLDKGTYYVNITPDFYVTSGTIKTTYSFSFEKNSRCEIESNESTSKATELEIGKMYTAYYGADGAFYEGAENDYFKFKVKKGKFYIVQFDGYDKISGTSAGVKVLNKSGKKVDAEEVVLSSGKTALAFVADSDGMYYVNIYGYHGEQFKYKIGIGNYMAKPDEPLISYVDAWRRDECIEITLDYSFKCEVEDTITGYQVSYSKNKDFSNAKTKKFRSNESHLEVKPSSTTGTYYVRVRAYRDTEKKIVYGAWSDTFEVEF